MRLPGADGSMIRVTCTHCGRAIEAPAASWEGWWEERALDAPAPSRRFEPRREQLERRRRTTASPPRVEPMSEATRAPGWRRILLTALVVAWMSAGVLLIVSVIVR